jgi:L-ascorbate metabolism protein UlaG (beta-lactamase superfamily)
LSADENRPAIRNRGGVVTDALIIDSQRHDFAIGLVGGPTVIIDYAGMRLVSDPTFDPAGDYGPYRKSAGPAVTPAQIGFVDVVFLSHDSHVDNFDNLGRQFAAAVPLLLTSPRSADRLGGNARGLKPFESTLLRTGRLGFADVVVHAVPAQHGPSDGAPDEYGDINSEVVGFVLQSEGLPTVYISGDNASIVPVTKIGARFGAIDVAVLHAGAARVESKFEGRPLTLTADRAADVAQLLDVSHVVPAHCEGWSIYSQTPDDLRRSFEDAGIGSRLHYERPGRWALLGVPPRG